MYFRRAAINHAISMARSYQGRYQHWKEQKIILPPPTKTEKFHVDHLRLHLLPYNYLQENKQLKNILLFENVLVSFWYHKPEKKAGYAENKLSS